MALNIGTEKARSELLIMPVLAEFYRQAQQYISLFSGHELNIDRANGLAGEIDFLISRSLSRSIITAPVVAVAEAKRDDFTKGSAQCIGQMIGARLFNQRHNQEMEVFGVITNGTIWEFARFAREDLVEVSGDFTIQDPEKIMGLLLVATGVVFLLGAQNSLGQWMLENFPALARIEQWVTPDGLSGEILKKGGP